MTCETALDRMLEAEAAELRGEVAGELGRHLAECPRCAGVARTLLAELEQVDAGLEAWALAGDADAAVDRVLGDRKSEIGNRKSGRAWRWAWVPLAAAAVLAGVLLFPRPEPEWGVAPKGPGIEPTVAVRPPADRSAAIMKTDNPNITIVWLYQEEET